MSNEEIVLDEGLEGSASGPDQLNLASTGQRFANYLVDMIAFYIIIFLLMMLIMVLSPDLIDLDSPMLNLFSLLSFFLYYAILESTTGKSFGKMVTGTAVVDANGNRPEMGPILLRTLSRFVPFEAFSAFSSSGRMWHDKWTDTYVVKTR